MALKIDTKKNKDYIEYAEKTDAPFFVDEQYKTEAPNIPDDMSDEMATLKDQKVAILNILEDVSDAQDKLKQRQYDLEVLQDLVQEMGKSLKIPVVMQRIIDALHQVLPHSVHFAYIPIYSDINSATLSRNFFVYVNGALGVGYLEQMEGNLKGMIAEILSKTVGIEQWLEEKWEPVFVSGESDNSDNTIPRSVMTIPFSVNNELLGVIDISSPHANIFREREKSLAHTITNTGATTIARLKQLFESEQSRTQSLVNGLSNGVIMFDISQRVTMANPAAMEMTGLPGKGYYLSEFVKLFDKPKFIEGKIIEALRTGDVAQVGEIKLSRFTYDSFVTTIRDHEKNIVGGAVILHDITHLKAIDKMKTEFVAVASHQLRTPLTPIMLFSEMLLNDNTGELNDIQREYLETINKSSRRMIELVNDLLNVSRLETGRLKISPSPTKMEDFIADVISEVEPVAKKKGCKIVFTRPESNLPTVWIDQSLVRQVIHNLITNAIRYTPAENGEIIVSVSQDGGEYTISVRDNGIGIPAEAQPRIFEKFFRADNAIMKEAEGSGLGMYVAKMVVEASGGKIWFESPVNGQDYGTMFSVSIPAHGMVARDGEKGLVDAVLE